MCIAVFSCGHSTVAGSLRPSRRQRAISSISGAWSVPRLQNRYSMPISFRPSRTKCAVECSLTCGALSTPDLPRPLEGKRELAPLIVHGDLVAVVRARKAALRAQAQVLERHELGRSPDAALQVVLLLERGKFRADQPQAYLLPFGDVAQRLEPAGAIRVVLEEKPVHVEPRERGLGDEIVAAAREPGAHEVAAAGM